LDKEAVRKTGIHWLSDDSYAKAIGTFRLQVSGVFKPFTGYGMDVFVPEAVEEIVKLAEDFGLRVRGLDKMISLEKVRNGNSGKSNEFD
jgi:hypothetical protein